MEIDFIILIQKDFASLVEKYNENQTKTIPFSDFNHLRAHYKYLFQLWKWYQANEQYPKIAFMLPSINEARWNSRASYFFMAYFLLPIKPKLPTYQNFSPAWFTAREKNSTSIFQLNRLRYKKQKIFFEILFQMQNLLLMSVLRTKLQNMDQVNCLTFVNQRSFNQEYQFTLYLKKD